MKSTCIDKEKVTATTYDRKLNSGRYNAVIWNGNQVPVIAMTASAMSAERENCMRMGFSEYISKPFIPGDLYRVISAFLVKQPPAS